MAISVHELTEYISWASDDYLHLALSDGTDGKITKANIISGLATPGALDVYYVKRSNNLSDIANPELARANLNLGSVALLNEITKSDIVDFNEADYATAAQGALANSALQPGDNISELVNDAGYILTSQKGVANGVASLDSNGKIPEIQIPAIAISNTFVVDSELEMLALDAQVGDVAIRNDESKSYILQGPDASNLSDWQDLKTPAGEVSSVNGQTGTVILDADDIDDSVTTNKFVTSAQITKLAGIEAGAQVNTVNSVNGQTGTVVLVKADVGLSNVDNTSDLAKPISTATQTALNAKQDTITGAATTITGGNLTANRAVISNGSGKVAVSTVTSTELGYVSGVTSAIQTQLNDKATSAQGALADTAVQPGANITVLTNDAGYITSADAPVQSVNGLTGTVVLTKASVGLGNVDDTSDLAKPISTATQAALDGKQATVTGAATTITGSNLTASRALVSNASGKVAVSSVMSSEVAHLSGVTAGIQGQINAKANSSVNLVAGTGLTGGGDLTEDRSFAVTYGTTAGTAAQGNDTRLSNAREWTATTVSQAEAEAGTATTRRAWTAQRVFQAIIAWWNGSADKTKLDGIATGATVNQTDAYLLSRTNHTGTQAHTTITGLGTAATTDVTTSTTDTTTGRVLTVGYGGLNVPTSLSDFSALAVGRNRNVLFRTPAWPADRPPFSSANYYSGIVFGHDVNGHESLLATGAGDGVLTGAMYLRNKVDGVWQPWRRVLDDRSLVTGNEDTTGSRIPTVGWVQSYTGNLTASRVLVSDSNGKVAASTVTDIELEYLTGVTSDIQTQLNDKATTVQGAKADTALQPGNNVSTLVNDADYISSDLIGIAGGIVPLGLDLKISSAYLPTYSPFTIHNADSEVEMLALDASKNDFCIRTDLETTFVLLDDDPTILANWEEFATGVTGVTSFNGQTGSIVVDGAVSTILTANLTSDRLLVSNGSGKITESTATAAEAGYLSGVTGAIQTQLNAKQDTITGGASTVTSSNLATSRALVSNGSGKITASAVTATELGYLDGVTASIQTQLNAKQGTLTPGSNIGISGGVISYTGPTYTTMTIGELNTGSATTDRVITANVLDSWLTGKNYLTGNQSITYTGDVTGSGTTSVALTITNGSVSNSKLANMAVNTIKGRISAGTGAPENLSAAQVRTILNVEDGATANQTISAGTGLTGGGSGDTVTLNVSYGTTAGTAAQGNDSRLSDSREWTAATVTQADAEAGTSTTRTAWTAQRVRQAIVAWWNTVGTTVGKAILSLANPSAVRFLRINADNTVTARSSSEMRTDLGLGTAATADVTTSQIPTTSGQLLKVGDFSLGLGTPRFEGDLDTKIIPGETFAVFSSTTTNYPDGFPSGGAIIRVRGGSSFVLDGPHSASWRLMQEAYEYTNASGPVAAVRFYTGNEWSPWRYNYAYASSASAARTNLELGNSATLNTGTTAGTVAEGNDPRLSDSREWDADTVPQPEAEGGTATTRRAWTAQRVRQAVLAVTGAVGTTVGRALFALTNPNAVRFLRVNADNTVSARSSSEMRTDLGLGTAATANVTTSTTDTTVGRVLKVGDHGLGLVPDLTQHDYDTLTSPGLYVAGGSSTNAPGPGAYFVKVSQGRLFGNPRYLQEAMTYASTPARSFTRGYDGTTWQPWVEEYNTSNVTGAVTSIMESDLTASRALVSDASGKVSASAVTSTEIGYLSGVTSDIQTQLNGKQGAITGAASTVVSANLPPLNLMFTDPAGKIATLGVTLTEAVSLSGVTSGIQTQLDGKAPIAQAIPSGGTTGQVLAKTSGTNYAVGWVTPSGGTNIVAGNGITVTGDTVSVDSTVVRTTGTQSIGGAKTFTSEVTAPSFNTSSSLKYKKDVMPFENALEKLMAIDVITYKRKIQEGEPQDDKVYLGVSAESLAKVVPELVRFKDGEPDSVNYAQGFALCVQAIQELVQELKKQ